MEKVKIAILGCGGMSGEHARRYKQMSDVEVVALCDVNEEIVEKYIEKNLADAPTKPQIFTDYDAMLAQSGADAITIVTPHTLHFEHGKKAIEAGLHVFMEKPMVTDSGQAHELKGLVEKSGKVFVVGYNSPCGPRFQWLREAIRSQKFGKLQTVTGWQTQNWLRGTAGTWRQNPDLSGGGQMYDSGAHMFAGLVFTVESPIDTVFAFVDNLGSPVDIIGTVNIKFQNGVLATMTIDGNSEHGAAGSIYTFEKGVVEIDGWNGGWIKKSDGSYGTRENFEVEGEWQTPNQNFINAILGREEPKTSPLNGVNQSELMDAIYESARTGQAAKPMAR